MANAHSVQATTPGQRRGRTTRAGGVAGMVLGASRSSGLRASPQAWWVGASVAAVRLESVTVLGLDGARPVLSPSRDPVAVILAVIPPGATQPARSALLDDPPDLSFQDSTGQYALDGSAAVL